MRMADGGEDREHKAGNQGQRYQKKLEGVISKKRGTLPVRVVPGLAQDQDVGVEGREPRAVASVRAVACHSCRPTLLPAIR